LTRLAGGRSVRGGEPHERELLAWLIRRREMVRGGLSDLGRLLSAYRTQKTCGAFARAKVQSLVALIAESEVYQAA